MSDVTLHLGDCMEVMKTLPAGSMDAVVTDPLYSTPVITSFGREPVKNIGDLSMQSFYFTEFKKVLERKMPESGRLFIFCDDKYYPILFAVFYSWNQSLVIWDKIHFGMGTPFRKRHELIMYACRDGYEVSDKGIPSILEYKTVPSGERLHGAQKPLPLVKFLVENFTKEGDTILDPFMGSGTTGVACVQTGRNFIGIEIDEGYYKIAERRIQEAQRQMVMELA